MPEKKANIIYNNKMGCITYQKQEYSISAMLVAFDDVSKKNLRLVKR